MQRRNSNKELWLAFTAVLLIALIYIGMVIWLNGIPHASDFFGHSIGVLGFILMLMTESLYSIRKRSRSARWGRMADWLDFHIFTGIVGPFMVLLHSSWKYNGLAGIVTLLMIIVVASGFIGRYIYTAVPRTVDGAEIESFQLEQQITQNEDELRNWLSAQPESVRALRQRFFQQPQNLSSGLALMLFRPALDLEDRFRWWLAKRRAEPVIRAQFQHLEDLMRQQTRLRRQIASLTIARRMLALWHTVHVPIGMALFTAAFIHIGAAIYYATLLR
jgi:hypothetical protein